MLDDLKMPGLHQGVRGARCDEPDELVRQTLSLIGSAAQFRSIECMQECRRQFAGAFVALRVKFGSKEDPVELARRAFELFALRYQEAEQSKSPAGYLRDQLMIILYRDPVPQAQRASTGPSATSP